MEDLIKINRCEEVVDNWGNTEQYKDVELFKLLTTPEDWTDDQLFMTDEGSYYIEDLIGKRVQVGTYIFTVQED
jgi:hypothetical protein